MLDRTLILQTERFAIFQEENELLREVEQKRNRFWPELLRDLNKVVAAPLGTIALQQPNEYHEVRYEQ